MQAAQAGRKKERVGFFWVLVTGGLVTFTISANARMACCCCWWRCCWWWWWWRVEGWLSQAWRKLRITLNKPQALLPLVSYFCLFTLFQLYVLRIYLVVLAPRIYFQFML